MFLEPVDLTLHPNLDEIINIGKISVEVYPEDSLLPPEHAGLNVPAAITLYDCWPQNKKTKQREKTENETKLRKYEEKLRQREHLGLHFKSYDWKNGVWKFEVDNFLLPDDEEKRK